MQSIDLNKAKHRFAELTEQAIGGDEVVITKSGQPIVKLVAVTRPKHQRHFGSARGLIKMSDDFDEPLEDFREYV